MMKVADEILLGEGIELDEKPFNTVENKKMLLDQVVKFIIS